MNNLGGNHMNRNVKTGIYTHNGEEVNFNFYTSLRAYDKMRFVQNVTNLVVGDNYNSVIKEMMFDFMIIEVFTDVDITEINNSKDAINMIEQLLDETNIVNIVKANAESGVIAELENAVDDNIEYRTGVRRNTIADSISSLLNTIETKLSDIDTDGMMQMAQVIIGMSGEMTPERMLEAYSKSDIFKEHYTQLIADREQHNDANESAGTIKKPAKSGKKISTVK